MFKQGEKTLNLVHIEEMMISRMNIKTWIFAVEIIPHNQQQKIPLKPSSFHFQLSLSLWIDQTKKEMHHEHNLPQLFKNLLRFAAFACYRVQKIFCAAACSFVHESTKICSKKVFIFLQLGFKAIIIYFWCLNTKFDVLFIASYFSIFLWEIWEMSQISNFLFFFILHHDIQTFQFGPPMTMTTIV
jgi:hypothetical protein